MASVKESVTEALLGSTEEPKLSEQAKQTFFRYAIKDDASGEPYLGREQFIDAVAPPSEDYVRSLHLHPLTLHHVDAQNSTRSSATSTASCSRSQTAKRLAA